MINFKERRSLIKTKCIQLKNQLVALPLINCKRQFTELIHNRNMWRDQIQLVILWEWIQLILLITHLLQVRLCQKPLNRDLLYLRCHLDHHLYWHDRLIVSILWRIRELLEMLWCVPHLTMKACQDLWQIRFKE